MKLNLVVYLAQNMLYLKLLLNLLIELFIEDFLIFFG